MVLCRAGIQRQYSLTKAPKRILTNGYEGVYRNEFFCGHQRVVRVCASGVVYPLYYSQEQYEELPTRQQLQTTPDTPGGLPLAAGTYHRTNGDIDVVAYHIQVLRNGDDTVHTGQV